MLRSQVTSIPSGRVIVAGIEEVTELSLPVVGISHEGRADIVRSMVTESLVVFLKREPDNNFDENAIKVCLGGDICIGYLSARAARVLAPELDRGIKYRCFTIDVDNEVDYIVPDVSLHMIREG